MLENWELNVDNLVAITTDNGANMVAAAKEAKFLRIPCFGHVLHNAVNGAMTDERITKTKGTQTISKKHSYLVVGCLNFVINGVIMVIVIL